MDVNFDGFLDMFEAMMKYIFSLDITEYSAYLQDFLPKILDIVSQLGWNDFWAYVAKILAELGIFGTVI